MGPAPARVPTHLPPHVVVTGPMGVGKSTTAGALADSLGWPWSDSDADIEALLGVSGGEIAAERGVPELHRLEAAVLLGALAADGPSVIAAAASVVGDRVCRDALARRALVVVLEATVDELVTRIATGDHRRAMARDEVAALVARRAARLGEVADVTLDASSPTSELVASILAVVRPHPWRGGSPGTT